MLTKREQFAAMAMSGCQASGEYKDATIPEIADDAVRFADALLSALGRDGEQGGGVRIAVDQFLRDALVALAGAVSTPEKGYKEDGGLRLLLLDIREMRNQYDALAAERDRLKEACADFRDSVLHGRAQLESPCLDGDQTNAVLGLFDDTIGAALSPTEAKG